MSWQSFTKSLIVKNHFHSKLFQKIRSKKECWVGRNRSKIPGKNNLFKKFPVGGKYEHIINLN